ncbi:MAG: TolC family protein, partial [Lewinella sp.]|nr:TolC family protein [Lewinella sp.]
MVNRYYHRLLPLLLLLGSALSLAGQPLPSVLSLEDCLNQARAHSPVLAQQPLVAEALVTQTRRLNRDYWPQLNLNGLATWQSEVISVPLEFPGIDIPSPPQDQYRVTLDVQQTIWDGGLTQARKAQAEAQARATNQELVVNFYQAERQIRQLYFGALLAERQRDYAELLQTDLQRQIQRLQAAVDNGVAVPSDVRQLQAKLLEVQQQQRSAQHQKTAALAALEQWTGNAIPPEINLLLPDEGELPGSNRRPELDLLDRQADVLQVSETLISRTNTPKLGAFASLGYGRPGLNLLASEWDTYAQVGARLTVPLTWLYTGNQNLEKQQLELQRNRLQQQREQFILQTEAVRQRQSEEIARLREQVAADETITELRAQITATAATQLQEGVITVSDYLTELNREDLARQNRL